MLKCAIFLYFEKTIKLIFHQNVGHICENSVSLCDASFGNAVLFCFNSYPTGLHLVIFLVFRFSFLHQSAMSIKLIFLEGTFHVVRCSLAKFAVCLALISAHAIMLCKRGPSRICVRAKAVAENIRQDLYVSIAFTT